MPIRVGVLTLSDTRTPETDESGRVVRELVEAAGMAVIAHGVVPDELAMVRHELIRLVDEAGCQLVLTTGGTGVAPRDVTPEATVAVCDRLLPGIGEAMRAASLPKTPMAMLSRAVAGLRGAALIVNLPGSPKGARECLEAVLPALPHGVALAAGGRPH